MLDIEELSVNPQIGLEKGTTERGIPKVSKSC